MKHLLLKAFCGLSLLTCQLFVSAAEANKIPCPEALQRLVEGNKRFAKDSSTHPDSTLSRRQEIASKQNPFAVVVGCSDSRVTPEIIFDQGLGDLFIIRTAGNVVGPIELESIEYSVVDLKSCLVVVLGHEACGAVTAVVKGQSKEIEAVAMLIEPAIAIAKAEPGEFTVEKAVKANIQLVVNQLKNTAILKEQISNGSVAVVGGYYHFQTGEVEWL